MSFLQSAPTVLRSIDRVKGGRTISTAEQDDDISRQHVQSSQGLLKPLLRLIRSPTSILHSLTYGSEDDYNDHEKLKIAMLDCRKQVLYARMSNVSL